MSQVTKIEERAIFNCLAKKKDLHIKLLVKTRAKRLCKDQDADDPRLGWPV